MERPERRPGSFRNTGRPPGPAPKRDSGPPPRIDTSNAVAPKSHAAALPWVRLRSAPAGPQAFRRMIAQADPKARPGDIVAVYDKSDAPYGAALYNPRSLVTLRFITRDLEGFEPGAFFRKMIGRAVGFRRDSLALDRSTDAYRLVHAHGDGLPGLVVDRFADRLVLELYSLGMFRQAGLIEGALLEHYPGAKTVRRASAPTQKMEGFQLGPEDEGKVRVTENGVVFEIDLSGGPKTGFFCDQRENRLAAAALARGRKVLDICGYTGGFSLYAMKLGGAEEATSVELDGDASERAKRNANLNGVRIDTVCADAFPYLRQMAANRRTYGLVVLDPYKLIATREGYDFGKHKYADFNRLALSVVEEGGFFVTCSCSGLFSWEEFQRTVRSIAGSTGRRLHIFRKSGAGPDHPFSADFPEGEYLKVLWCRVF
ncbi:MAG: class I SAM-dependent rRNA methyltransferase [Elusimicrobia bacterium]|nr:class I SAM-dependent rRNA methyltransferase [Elusimicrobiota bacterium]